MILVFGGTTEGKQVAALLEEAGHKFAYATRGVTSSLKLIAGEWFSGGMDAEAMLYFCRNHQVRLIVDAAHPFAQELRKNMVQTAHSLQLPLLRYERNYSPRDPDLIYCRDFQDLLQKLRVWDVKRLLAWTGVRTIPNLKPYWETHLCWFRIMDWAESRAAAEVAGFPKEQLLYWNGVGDERELLSRLRPDAVVTKESGETGFFCEKVAAARAANLPVFVVERPLLPGGIEVVQNVEALRGAINRLLPGYFPLRSGYTTGACAAAAAAGAFRALLSGQPQPYSIITLPSGEEVSFRLVSCAVEWNSVTAVVVKFAGDDPDVTNGCRIEVCVSYNATGDVHFLQGIGVGVVTFAGLGLAVGEPAVNPVPRNMICELWRTLAAEYDESRGVDVRISVPGGELLAEKTLNRKLGITGGISIIGTSGIVRPFSVEAFVETIRRELSVAAAQGCMHVVLNSGAKSARFLQGLYPELSEQAFVHYGNFIGKALTIAAETIEIRRVTLGLMMGKAVKLAAGNLNTHSREVSLDRDFLIRLAETCGYENKIVESVRDLKFARDLWTIFEVGAVTKFEIGKESHPCPLAGLSEIPIGKGPNGADFFQALLGYCYAVCKPLLGTLELTLVLISEAGESLVMLSESGAKNKETDAWQ